LIVTELASNVVRHAYPLDHPGALEVQVECDRDEAIVTVRDWGRGFGNSAEAGLGFRLRIVEALTDDVRIERSDGTTVATRLVLGRRPGRPSHQPVPRRPRAAT
jgi:anti-sigma regulatory factor (Ser/Thr protein kinase)